MHQEIPTLQRIRAFQGVAAKGHSYGQEEGWQRESTGADKVLRKKCEPKALVRKKKKKQKSQSENGKSFKTDRHGLLTVE